MCVQKVAGASPDRMERQWVKLAPPGRGGNAFVLVSHSHDKTSRLRVGTKRCWTLAEDINPGVGAAQEEEGSEEARLVNLARHV